MRSPFIASLLCATGLTVTSASAAVIANGGFETGDLTGWTLTNGSIYDTVCLSGDPVGSSTCSVNGGNYAMTFGQFEAITTLSQSIATTPGSTYTISFFLANVNPVPDPEATFAMSWNGATQLSLGTQASFPYSQRVILNLTATSSTTTLAFAARHDPSQWFLDDVSISDSAVPEPATILMTAMGAAVLLWRRRS